MLPISRRSRHPGLSVAQHRATGAQGFMYGIGGAGGESGSGMMLAVNDTTLTEWPVHVPAAEPFSSWFGSAAPVAKIARPMIVKGGAAVAGRARFIGEYSLL